MAAHQSASRHPGLAMLPGGKRRQFDNLSPAQIFDQYGETGDAAARHRKLRTEILRLDVTDGEGETYRIEVREKSSTLFDHERCRELLGEEAYATLWHKTPTVWVQAFRKRNGIT